MGKMEKSIWSHFAYLKKPKNRAFYSLGRCRRECTLNETVPCRAQCKMASEAQRSDCVANCDRSVEVQSGICRSECADADSQSECRSRCDELSSPKRTLCKTRSG